MTSIGSYGKLQICPPDGTTCHGHAYISWTDIGHAHNEDNDEDKKNFNKLNNLKPVTIFYGLIPDNAIQSPSLVKHATEKNNPYCII